MTRRRPVRVRRRTTARGVWLRAAWAATAIVAGSVSLAIGVAGAVGTVAYPPGGHVPQAGGVGAQDTGNAVAEPPERAESTPAPAEDPITFPAEGRGAFGFAAGSDDTLGTAGTLLTFRVAVEKGIDGVEPDRFARDVVSVLGDRRGWTAAGQRRLRLVGRDGDGGAAADFTVYLTTPATRDKLCGSVYDRYTSCRNGERVVLNVARWVDGVPHIGGALDDYRAYMINHEVGHRLGYGHQRCPRRGRPAPIMQQQTLGMHGCQFNPWPMRAGELYAGPPGEYDDPIPRV